MTRTRRRKAAASATWSRRAELSCEQCFDELDRYVELELAGEDADAAIPGMQAHLEGCPACREDHVSLRAFVTSDLPGDARHAE